MEPSNERIKMVVFICSTSEISLVHSYREYQPDDIHFVAISREIATEVRTVGRDCSVLFEFLSTNGENELRKKTLFGIDQWADSTESGDISIGRAVQP